MSSEVIEQARREARQKLGSALAEKATDEFCLAVASPRYAAAPGAEMLTAPHLEVLSAPPPAEPQAVIELKAPEREAEAVPGSRPARPDEVAAALRLLGRDVEWAEAALASGSRQAAVQAERDRFYLQLGGIRDAVERGAATLADPGIERPRIGIAAAPVQACWLNSTIRAETHASVLGEVAEHGEVERIDLPRRLEGEEVDVTIAAATSLRKRAGISGGRVLVGVIDSEVQLDHPALAGRVVHRRNYTQEPFGTPGSHGTSVAGLIAADAKGFTGMAPGAHIYSYKVLAAQRALNSTDFEGALAIQHALEDGVRVVNCSWGSGPASDGSSREARACDTAWRLGMVVVKSAGNNGPGPSTLTTPADAEGVIAVGAATADGRSVPSYSSRGPVPNGRKRPHLVAPGGDFGAEIDGILLGGGIGTLGGPGTSFAAPHVTGLAALLLEQAPGMIPDEVRDRIVSSCRRLPGASEDEQGAGLVEPTAF